MTIHLVYRSYGGENNKRRPGYYSKLLTLNSFLRAAERVPEADLVFINDGPIPADRLGLMTGAGRVVSMGDTAAGMRASYLFGLRFPDREGWAADDVVMFVEDDYLFTEVAFVAFREAAEQLPEASYFSLYGERPDFGTAADRELFSIPDGWHPQPDRVVGGRTWFNQASITSTFGARVGALRADLDIFEQCMGPFRRRYLDHESCLMVQGAIPYRGWQLVSGLPGDFEPSVRNVLRALALVPFRFGLNRRARQQLRPHYLYALTPNEATHVEHPVISPDRDWERLAGEVRGWAERQPAVAAIGLLEAPSDAA